jgi:uncharacterized protein (TIGR02147 family)
LFFCHFSAWYLIILPEDRQDLFKAQDMTPSVYDYQDFRKFIADAQRAIKAAKPFFTYRHIAALIGLKSPGHITWIIQGKRNLSKKKILPFAKVLGLNEKETGFFTHLVHFDQAKTHLEKKLHLDRLVTFLEPKKTIVKPPAYEFYSKWYYSAVRELFAIYALGDDYKRIARLIQPAITPREAKQSVLLLCGLGLVKKDNTGHYRQVNQAVSTGDAWRSVAIRQFQMDTFDLAKKALNSINAKERDVSTLTMSISDERFAMIRERIKQFRNELVTLITSDKSPGRVYQLSMALFPLSQEREP